MDHGVYSERQVHLVCILPVAVKAGAGPRPQADVGPYRLSVCV